MNAWRRLAVVGTGARGEWWADAIARRLAGSIELVALCDRNPGRNQRLAALLEVQGQRPALYDDCQRMLAEMRPDVLLVAVPDHAHAVIACAAMHAGIDVLLEKPIACTAADCQAIVAARRATGRRCVVGFNLRWAPAFTQLKDLIQSGTIGEPVAVDLQWLLDVRHGADYFRRWHRHLANSGGLLVHKATHHFDLVNWLLSSTPRAVFARAARNFYRPQTALALGLAERGERCLDCPVAQRCAFRLDLKSDAHLAGLYLAHETHDGYQRDRCVFSEEIDIPDSMSVTARYASGALLTYSLQAFAPREGLTLGIDGTRGRIEFVHREPDETSIQVLPLAKPAWSPGVWKGAGSHGGGDHGLIDALFAEPLPDRWGRAADERAGAWSALLGIAANHSIAAGREVTIAELYPALVADEAAASAPASASSGD